ncbi:unnamed protein product [Ilex paraguariensis]|uniref:Uncharacterized protein n=1 Tax=Ilex paraguariensis TaxID=185542 RepID=A0ABC8TUH4_9AQUA
MHGVSDYSFIEENDKNVDEDYFDEDIDEIDDGEDSDQVSLDSEDPDELREEEIKKPKDDDIF